MYKNDIFNTTMGKVKDIKNLKKAIEFYLVANSNSSLFRDVVMPARTIFISGILPADREIPMFSLPVIINDIKNEQVEQKISLVTLTGEVTRLVTAVAELVDTQKKEEEYKLSQKDKKLDGLVDLIKSLILVIAGFVLSQL